MARARPRTAAAGIARWAHPGGYRRRHGDGAERGRQALLALTRSGWLAEGQHLGEIGETAFFKGEPRRGEAGNEIGARILGVIGFVKSKRKVLDERVVIGDVAELYRIDE